VDLNCTAIGAGVADLDSHPRRAECLTGKLRPFDESDPAVANVVIEQVRRFIVEA
jgi:hypothetical protein